MSSLDSAESVAASSQIVAALDFGTTFSGFAFAHRDCGKVFTLDIWDGETEAGARPYSKTQTSLYYKSQDGKGLSLKAWGWPALLNFNKDCQKKAKMKKGRSPQNQSSQTSDPAYRPPQNGRRPQKGSSQLGDPAYRPHRAARDASLASAIANSPDHLLEEPGHFITRFKLHLARDTNIDGAKSVLSADELPEGITAERAITDYLRKMATLAMGHMELTYGKITGKEVQWCLTVPAIWDDKAKQKMKVYAEKAGMVKGPHSDSDAPLHPGWEASPHKLLICLEPEAASMYCRSKAQTPIQLQKGDQYLLADIGGGTVDIVVHERINESSDEKVVLKEVMPSYGDLCGGTYVDEMFENFLATRIGCYKEYVAKDLKFRMEVLRAWGVAKGSYDSDFFDGHAIQIPTPLQKEWRLYDEANHLEHPPEGYDDLEISNEEMMSEIFDPVVNKIIDLIKEGLSDKVKMIMVVGGFSTSPYLRDRIKRACEGMEVIHPNRPGSAICEGAVLIGLAGEDAIVTSRISRKSYGIAILEEFEDGVHREDKRHPSDSDICEDVFFPFVRKGQEIKVDEKHTHEFVTCSGKVPLEIYSCNLSEPPLYVTDDGMVHELTYWVDLDGGKMHEGHEEDLLEVEMTMRFGTSRIELSGKGINFGDPNDPESTFKLELDE